MKAHLFLLLLLTLSGNLLAQPAEGGKEIGNGGDVVVCRDRNDLITSVELLDFYEARTLRNVHHDLGSNDLSIDEKIQIAINRLHPFSLQLAEKFQTNANKFMSEASFLPNITLIDIPDSLHLIIPNGCTVEQIIIQKDPIYPEDFRYIINKDLWDILDNDNKAGLILHEIIYQDSISRAQTNSTQTRYFNAILTSAQFEKFNNKRMAQLFKSVGIQEINLSFPDLGLNNITFNNNEISFYDNGNIKNWVVQSDTVCHFNLHGIVYDLNYKKNESVSFHPNGMPRVVRWSQPNTIYFPDYKVLCDTCEIKMFSNGMPQEISGNARLEGKVNGMGNLGEPITLIVTAPETPNGSNFDEKIRFYNNGSLLGGTFQNSQNFLYGTGKIIKAPKFSHAYFYENGNLKSLNPVLPEGSEYDDFLYEITFQGRLTKINLAYFYENGNFQYIALRYKHNFILKDGQILTVDRQLCDVTFYENGNLRAIGPINNTYIYIQDKKISITKGITIFESGNIESVVLNKSITLKNTQGKTVKYKKDHRIYLDTIGLVEKALPIE